MNYDENGKQLRSRPFHDKSDKPESLAKATNSSKICLGIIPDSERLYNEARFTKEIK